MEWLVAAGALVTLAVPLVIFYRPLGDYMAWVFTSPKHWRGERWAYRLIGVDPSSVQTWGGYLRSVLGFSFVGFILLYVLQRVQAWLPYSLGMEAMSPDLAFNTAASFVGNTNWQSYVPEQTVGYAVQVLGLTVQSFTSAAVGIAVAIALVRGIASHRGGTVGNFWVDLIRATGRILLPLSTLAAIILIIAGVVQGFADPTQITTIAGGTQVIPSGPVATQEAIKLLGTNGGGFFNANSAHPFENPTPWSNMLQTFLLIVIPFALPRTLGTMVRNQRMGLVIVSTMAIIFIIVFCSLTAAELGSHGAALDLAGGAMEGKETRFDIVGSTIFAAATTGTTGGAVNSMHSSYTALGGAVMMANMALGEVSPGGVGTGLYSMLVYVIIAVFLIGLLLGRAPVFLGKRIGVREIILSGAYILIPSTLSLGGLAISLSVPGFRAATLAAMGGTESHDLSEVIYAFLSCALNNGSAFAGFNANSAYLNTMLGIVILLGRFIPIAVILALAGSFAEQDSATTGVEELPILKPMFVGLLTFIIVFLSLPTFLPILLAGPLAQGLG